MRDVIGLGILEVVVALLILTVGVLAAFGLQASSLQGTQSATIIHEMSNIAERELQAQRQFKRRVEDFATQTPTCRTSFDDLFGCSVSVFPCSLSGGTLTCQSATVAGPAAHQITVEVTGPQNRRVSVSTVVK